MEKITNRSALTYVIDTYGDLMPNDVKAKLSAMVTALDKKANGERKPTAVQVENARITSIIHDMLQTSGKHMTISDIIKAVPECADMNTQKVSPMLNGLCKRNVVAKEIIKGRTYFYAVEG